MPHNAGPIHEVKANLFRVLGHPARVRILELLRDGGALGRRAQGRAGLDSGGRRSLLAALRRIGLVELAAGGDERHFRVDDERVFDLLAAGRAIIGRRLAEQQSILRELETP